jgi:hypothetical protein
LEIDVGPGPEFIRGRDPPGAGIDEVRDAFGGGFETRGLERVDKAGMQTGVLAALFYMVIQEGRDRRRHVATNRAAGGGSGIGGEKSGADRSADVEDCPRER